MFAGFSKTHAVLALASATALGFIAVEPSALATETVDIQVEIIGACEGNIFGVSYNPALASGIEFPMSAGDGFAQKAYIDLNIEEGQDAECNELFGSVNFTESGFEDANIETTFDCDDALVNKLGGSFTCGDGTFTPQSIGVSVEALAGTQLGTFTNTIYLTLVAD
jgi:hypothetical protein